jgi:hypothetical protein
MAVGEGDSDWGGVLLGSQWEITEKVYNPFVLQAVFPTRWIHNWC